MDGSEVSAANRSLIGPGRLVLVVGPSGAGKDTLIAFVRDRLAGNASYLFPRRIVTRPPTPAEDNVEADPSTFRAIADAGGFALTWAAHGHSYGIPAAIDHALHEGRTVLCNVSREVVGIARQRYGMVTVVEVTAPPDILEARVAGRSRASDGDAASRVGRRVAAAVEPDVVIVNAAGIKEAAGRLLAVVSGPVPAPAAF
jgi:ribose 1,5-bisphosphokinase